MQYFNVLGVRVCSPASRDELIGIALEQNKSLIALGPEKLMTKSHIVANLLCSNLGYADGIGVVLALKQKGDRSAFRIPGCELWLDLIDKCERLGRSVYLIGGTENVIARVDSRLREEFPDLNLVGFRSGFLDLENDLPALYKELIQTNAEVVLVAMGSPLQERVIAELLEKHSAVYMGLGGSFDVYSGTADRAPVFVRALHLEWLYRLLAAPSRWPRYIPAVKYFGLLCFGRV